MPSLSLILCTHNPKREFLERTLEALQKQSLAMDVWEFILIDNGSSHALAESWSLAWHPQGRIIRENTLGLTPARLRGINESTSDLLVFVDDDNILDPHYLRTALEIARRMPHLGAFGGSVRAEFESPPPIWAVPYTPYLAIRPVSHEVWANEYRFDIVPVGAGMCIRKPIALAYASCIANDTLRLSLDRKGGSLSSGGDSDMAFTAVDQGLGIGLFPELKLVHLMPEARLKLDYLSKLLEAISYSTTILLHLRQQLPAPRRINTINQILEAYRMWRQPRQVRVLEAARKRGLMKARAHIASL